MEKFVFKAKAGSMIPEEKAQSYGERLYELMRLNDKKELTPKEVVEDAKKTSIPYHDFFEWEDSIAGEKYRVWQARSLMGGILKIRIIESEPEPVSTRAFHCVSVGDNGAGHSAYVPEEIVFKTIEYSEQIIEKALDEAESWNERYKQYGQLSRISLAIEDALRERKK